MSGIFSAVVGSFAPLGDYALSNHLWGARALSDHWSRWVFRLTGSAICKEQGMGEVLVPQGLARTRHKTYERSLEWWGLCWPGF